MIMREPAKLVFYGVRQVVAMVLSAFSP